LNQAFACLSWIRLKTRGKRRNRNISSLSSSPSFLSSSSGVGVGTFLGCGRKERERRRSGRRRKERRGEGTNLGGLEGRGKERKRPSSAMKEMEEEREKGASERNEPGKLDYRKRTAFERRRKLDQRRGLLEPAKGRKEERRDASARVLRERERERVGREETNLSRLKSSRIGLSCKMSSGGSSSLQMNGGKETVEGGSEKRGSTQRRKGRERERERKRTYLGSLLLRAVVSVRHGEWECVRVRCLRGEVVVGGERRRRGEKVSFCSLGRISSTQQITRKDSNVARLDRKRRNMRRR